MRYWMTDADVQSPTTKSAGLMPEAIQLCSKRGVAGLTYRDNPRTGNVVLEDLFVSPGARGRGLARKLVQAAAARHRGRVLELVPNAFADKPKSNSQLRSMYARLGFKAAGHYMRKQARQAQPVRPPVSIPQLYKALAAAEHRNSKGSRWIRTRHWPGPKGSTAYGPVQITRTLMEDLYDRYPGSFKGQVPAVKQFINQGKLFARYGREPNRAGYDPIYDYGGAGTMGSTAAGRRAYRGLANTAIRLLYKEQGYDPMAFARRWRAAVPSTDPKYYTAFSNALYGAKQ